MKSVEHFLRDIAQKGNEQCSVFFVQPVKEESESVHLIVTHDNVRVDLVPDSLEIEFADGFSHVWEKVSEVFTKHSLRTKDRSY